MYYDLNEAPDSLNISLVDKAMTTVMQAFDFANSVITVDFSEDFTDGQCGFADYDDEEYIVYLNPDLSDEQLVRTLIHEMVHIHQYISGRLVHDGPDTYWDGIQYDGEYHKLPWEIDAYAWEDKLSEGVVNGLYN